MKKYNKSEIMKRAWRYYREDRKYADHRTFADSLKFAWKLTKLEVKSAEKKAALKTNEEKSGIVEMFYGDYKKNYVGCKTVEGSYNPITKTIKVYINILKSSNVSGKKTFSPIDKNVFSNKKYFSSSNWSEDGRCYKGYIVD